MILHNKVVSSVQKSSSLPKVRIMHIKLAQPFVSHLLPTSSRFDPHIVKVTTRAVVLRDSDSISQVKHCMPPTVRDEDCFTGTLCKFVALKALVITSTPACFSAIFNPWKNVHEIVNCLVILILPYQTASFSHMLWYVRWKEYPSFLPRYQRVPGTRRQRVLVNCGTRPLRANQKPSIRRPPTLPNKMEKVFIEKSWNFVVF
mmetsp:Transcript_11374/g.33488  ORF Transcript_11374/g.33488 Transcript_11374/m.33488 type:complete len:202 (+) Transcript_11374:525-1130(+)